MVVPTDLSDGFTAGRAIVASAGHGSCAFSTARAAGSSTSAVSLLRPLLREAASPIRSVTLSPNSANLTLCPIRARVTESALDFALIWPKAVPEERILDRRWTRDNGAYVFEFKPAMFEANSGRLSLTPQHNCWTFQVDHVGRSQDRRAEIPPLPIKCPQCHADWEMFTSGQGARPIFSRSRTRSPIRTMGTGYEKIAQVLVDALTRELIDDGEQARRLVLFSDSRQDAAKLSAGLEKRHYQDLVRELIVQQLGSGSADDVELVAQFLDGDRSAEAVSANQRLRVDNPPLYNAMRDAHDDLPGAQAEVDRLLADARGGRTSDQHLHGGGGGTPQTGSQSRRARSFRPTILVYSR